MKWSLPGSSVHGILQVRILEWVAISYSSLIIDLCQIPKIWKTSLYVLWDSRASPVAQMVKNLPAVLKTQFQSMAWEDPLEEGMATQSSITAWKTPWTEEPGGVQFMGLHRVGHNWATNTVRDSEGLEPLAGGRLLIILVQSTGSGA